MNMHICKEDPCPVSDSETLAMLQSEFTTRYTAGPELDPIITRLNRLERMMIVESITRTLLLLVYMIGVLIFMAIP